jgi:hypothetical protein
MKKVLLASAALLALGTAAQAAEPVKLSIGGYATEFAGYAGNKDSAIFTAAETTSSAADHKVSFDTQDDVNINFVGSTKLDNGISVGVEVDTFGSQRLDSRTNSSGNTDVKRSFVTVGSAFGTAIVGEREDALYIVHNSAPDVGAAGLQDGAWFQFVADPAYHKTFNATTTSRYDDRGNKISYVTPSFYGLAAAASYAPDIGKNTAGGHTTVQSSSDTNGNNIAANNSTTSTQGHGLVNGTDFGTGDVYGAGLAYANTFSGVSIKADAGMAQANIANLRLYQSGLQVSYAGFTVGGSLLNRNVDSKATLGTQGTQGLGTEAAAYAGQSWDAGVAYANGPYAISLGYFHDTTKKAEGTTGHVGYAADSTQVYALGAKYILGPGVALQESIDYVDYKTHSTNSGDSNKGVLAITAIRVDF